MESQERKQLYTKFINKKDFARLMNEASKDFIDSFEKEIRYENDARQVTIADGFSYIDCIAVENNWHDVIRKVFLQCWSHAESLIVSSGNITTYFLAQRFIGKKDKTLKELTQCVFPSTKEISFSSLSQILESEIFNFVKDIIEFGGINGKISIKKTSSAIAAIELVSGHNFLVGCAQGFVSELETRDEAKIILFDGIIQNVGEVDRIFSACHEKRISCIIVARGFGDDVISTINKNYHRNTLDIIPIKIDDNIGNINIINDMSACIGDCVISAESGIRLSNIEISEQPTLNNVSVSTASFKFGLLPANKQRVESRIESIKNRIANAHWDEEMSFDDIQNVFVPRLSALSSNSIILWAPGDDRQHSFIKNRFLFSLNYIAAFANSGVIRAHDVFGTKHNLPEFLPASIVDISESLSKKMYSSLRSAGGCVAIQ